MSEPNTGGIVIYQTEDGRNQIECQLVDGTIWLSQSLMGELFQRSKQTISEHLQNLFAEGELAEAAKHTMWPITIWRRCLPWDSG